MISKAPRKVKGIPRLLLLMRTRFSCEKDHMASCSTGPLLLPSTSTRPRCRTSLPAARKGMIQQGSFLAALGQRALSDPLSCSLVSLSLPRRGSELHWHAATQNQVRGSDENHSRNAAARVQVGGPGVGTTTSEWTLTDEGIFAIFGRAAHLRVIPIYVLNSDFVAPVRRPSSFELFCFSQFSH
ncbi:hypothetical protein BKA80DRAFT_137756 [Phyllosticta citrichinensis]